MKPSIGFDMDGVLCPDVWIPPKWLGDEIVSAYLALRRARLPVLYRPRFEEYSFTALVTGRREKDIGQIFKWLYDNDLDRFDVVCALSCNGERWSYDRTVDHKEACIRSLGLDIFVESNPQTVRELKDRVGGFCDVFLGVDYFGERPIV